MYIINIVVSENITTEQQAKLFAEHAEWFKKYFQAGKFLARTIQRPKPRRRNFCPH